MIPSTALCYSTVNCFIGIFFPGIAKLGTEFDQTEGGNEKAAGAEPSDLEPNT